MAFCQQSIWGRGVRCKGLPGMGLTAKTSTSSIAMINIVMKSADGSGGVWQDPVQLIPQDMYGNPEQFVARIKVALPLVNNLRVQFNEFSFNPDGSMHPQMERFLAAATAAGYKLTMVYAGGDAQNIGRGTEDWPALSNANAYAALQENYGDVSGAWDKLLDWMDGHKTVETAVYGWELMNESAGYKHAVRANGTQGDLSKADFVKLYADHAIALTTQIEARVAGKILVGGWGYNGDFLTLAGTKIGTVSALDYLRAGVGDNLVWSSHLYPGWMGTDVPTTTAGLSSLLDRLFAPVAQDAVLVTETNVNGYVDDPNAVLNEADIAAANYGWFAAHGMGLGWFPGLQTGASSLMVINGDGSLTARHQHALAHALDGFSLGQAGTLAQSAGQAVGVTVTKVALRNQAYEIAAGELTFDVAKYAGFGFGYNGNDTITGRNGSNDFLYGGVGNDVLSGLAGDDFLFGQNGADHLIGGSGIDALFGGLGNDRLDGGSSRDQLYGGTGNDTYIVDQSADSIRELKGEGLDTVLSTARVYSLSRAGLELQTYVENLSFIGTGNFSGTGNALANRLAGGAGNDQLSGLAGQDTLLGGLGGDRLRGGSGNDVLTGGGGSDHFVFFAKHGSDRILDFKNNVDTIELHGLANINSAQQALSKATQVGADVVFNFGSGDIITVLNITKAALLDDLLIV